MDLCECICQQIQRSMQNAEGILQSISGSEVISHGGEALPGLARPSEGLSPAALLSMLFVFLTMMMLFSVRRPADRNSTQKPRPGDSSGSPDPPSDGDVQ